MFDTIHGHNPQQETFSKNTTKQQRKNRLILLNSATKSGLVNYEWWHSMVIKHGAMLKRKRLFMA